MEVRGEEQQVSAGIAPTAFQGDQYLGSRIPIRPVCPNRVSGGHADFDDLSGYCVGVWDASIPSWWTREVGAVGTSANAKNTRVRQ